MIKNSKVPIGASENYAITFACYKGLTYTRQCIESLSVSGVDMNRLIVIDNASGDGTADFLDESSVGLVIRNSENRGCGVAWNQGALALQAEWTIVMNNDLVVTAGWLDGLIKAGIQHSAGIVSSALIEGPLDYELEGFAKRAYGAMHQCLRVNLPHAICMAIHESVWREIGYFRSEPKLLGFEDTLFFRAAELAGIKMITTGSSWVHHYGSVTQKLLKEELGIHSSQGLGDRYNYRLLGDSWFTRKRRKAAKLKLLSEYRSQEVSLHDMSIHGLRKSGKFEWI